MTAAVLTIGTELTRGELVDTNAAWLATELTQLGFDVVEQRTVADDPGAIATAIQQLAARTKVLVATGGLGPTTDDLTVKSAAQAAGVRVERDPAMLEVIRRRYASRGRDLSEGAAAQADRPTGSDALPNAEGTAPGFAFELDGCRCHFLPGVPREMKAMFDAQVLPRIASLGVRESHQIHLRTFGMPESEIGARLDGIEADFEGVTLGYRAHFPEIEVKVLARVEGDAARAEERAREAAAEVRVRLGDLVYGEKDDSFPGAVGDALRRKGAQLAVAESCTGGMIGELLTAVPGSSEYVLLSAVTYANAAKTVILGVPTDVLRAYGAVSSETARAMCEGARRLGACDYAVATTGVAGPGGGSEEKPVGTVWFGLARPEGTVTMRYRFSGDRDQVRTMAAYVALDLVRRASLGLDLDACRAHSRIERRDHPAPSAPPA